MNLLTTDINNLCACCDSHCWRAYEQLTWDM